MIYAQGLTKEVMRPNSTIIYLQIPSGEVLNICLNFDENRMSIIHPTWVPTEIDITPNTTQVSKILEDKVYDNSK